MQTETNCGIKPLTDEDIKDLVKSEADDLGFKTTFDYLADLSKADEAAMEGAAPIEKIMWVVRHAHLNGFKRGITVYNDVVRQVLEEDNMRVDDIKIFPCFATHEPKPEKMQQKEQYFTETGDLQSQIVIDSQGNLVDGYTSYLLAVKYGIQCVPIKCAKRQIIRASHRSGGKMYAWELPGLLIGQVHIGDKVLVRADRGIKAVTVAAVEDYSGQEPEPLKMAIRIKKRYSDKERDCAIEELCKRTRVRTAYA